MYRRNTADNFISLNVQILSGIFNIGREILFSQFEELIGIICQGFPGQVFDLFAIKREYRPLYQDANDGACSKSRSKDPNSIRNILDDLQ